MFFVSWVVLIFAPNLKDSCFMAVFKVIGVLGFRGNQTICCIVVFGFFKRLCRFSLSIVLGKVQGGFVFDNVVFWSLLDCSIPMTVSIKESS